MALKVCEGGMPWPKTDKTYYYAQFGHIDKGHIIKELVFCNCWDLEPLNLINGLVWF